MSFKFSRTDDGDATTIYLTGTLDAVTCRELDSTLDELVNQRRSPVVFDLADLDLIDAEGVGELVKYFKHLRATGAEVRAINLRDQPKAIFRLLRLDRLFHA